MILIVDVDLTVCDPIPLWAQWLEEHSEEGDYPLSWVRDLTTAEAGRGKINYDITSYWEGLLKPGVDPFDFWRDKHLYDRIEPFPEAVECLQQMYDAGMTIRFATHVKGSHYFSKVEFLKKHFPYLDAIVATKEKWAIAGDALVDDRVNNLTCTAFQHKILFPSPYTQTQEPTEDIYHPSDWWGIRDYFLE